MAYDWCSAICENHQSLVDWDSLLLACLEIGFRHLDVRSQYTGSRLAHTEHHRGLVDVVFNSLKGEMIADLLYAWTIGNNPLEPEHTSLLNICAGRLVSLHNLVPFSPRLRRLVIRSIELIGYKGFEGVGVERYVGVLNHLCVTSEDMDVWPKWAVLLLDTLQSSEGVRHLPHRYWELLVDLVTPCPRWLRDEVTYNPRIVTFLVEAGEWSKLECWMGIIWIVWPPGAGGMAEEEFDHSMRSLFRHRPGAAQKLDQWVGGWSREYGADIPESFQRICKQANEATQRDAP